MNVSPRRIALIVSLMIVALIIMVGAQILWHESKDPVSAVAGSSVGGPYELINQDGQTVTDKTYADDYKLIYFGFTFCPAICPTELTKIADALDQLGPLADQIQPIFITIDPERDTQAVMKQYVPLFHPRLEGLTGSPEQIATVADAYKVYYAKAEDPAATEYTMDHSSYIYFMSPDDELIKLFRIDDAAQNVAQYIQGYLQ